jgi:hypothetical protein
LKVIYIVNIVHEVVGCIHQKASFYPVRMDRERFLSSIYRFFVILLLFSEKWMLK